jgi:hypothetical protein
MRSLTALGIEFAGEEGHGEPIWGKKGMSAHRWVSRRVRGWSLESGSRRSFGWSLVDGGAVRSAHELAGVSSRRRARCGRVSGEGGRGRASGRVHFARDVAVEVMHATRADKRGQERRAVDKWRRSSAGGRPRRRAQARFRRKGAGLTEPLHRRLSPKPERIRRWRS